VLVSDVEVVKGEDQLAAATVLDCVAVPGGGVSGGTDEPVAVWMRYAISRGPGPGKSRFPPEASSAFMRWEFPLPMPPTFQPARRSLFRQVGVDDGLHVEHVHRPIPVEVGKGNDPRISLRPQEHIDTKLNIQHVYLAVLIDVLRFGPGRRRGGRWD